MWRKLELPWSFPLQEKYILLVDNLGRLAAINGRNVGKKGTKGEKKKKKIFAATKRKIVAAYSTIKIFNFSETICGGICCLYSTRTLVSLNWISNVCYGSHLWQQLSLVIVLRFVAVIATANCEKGLETLRSPLIVKNILWVCNSNY